MNHSFDDLERRLTVALHQEASIAMTMTDTNAELDRWRDNNDRRKNRNRIIAAAAATAAVIVGVVLGLTATHSNRSEPRPLHKPTPVAPSPAHNTVTDLAALASGTPVARAAGPVNPAAVAFGAVWATDLDAPHHAVYRLDARTGKVLGSTAFAPAPDVLPLPTRVGDVILVAATSHGHLGYLALNGNGRRVGFLPATHPGPVAGDANGGWLQLTDDTVGQVDATGTHVVRRVTLHDSAGVLISSLATRGGVAYIGTGSPMGVHRIDAASGRETAFAELDGNPETVTATNDSVYVTTNRYTMLRLDPTTLDTLAIADSRVTPSSYFLVATAPPGELWITPNQGGIVQLDPRTLKMLRSFQVVPDVSQGYNFGASVTRTRIFIGDGARHRVVSIPR